MREIWEKYDQLEFWRGALVQGENGVRKTAVVGAGKPDIWPRARPWWFCASGGIVPSLIQISLARKRPTNANHMLQGSELDSDARYRKSVRSQYESHTLC
jgi:hypothetical protein